MGHRGDDTLMFGLYRLRVGDLVEGVEPMVGALGQPDQQPRDGVGADVDDGLVGWVLDHLGDVDALGALFEPFVGQRSNVALSPGRLASISVIAPAADGT